MSRGNRLYRDVADRMLALISSGTYPAGGRLPPERELAEQFSVSRPTIREAIIALEAKGLVRIKSGSGVYVLSPDVIDSLASGQRVIADSSAGTIDYASGKVSIDAIKFTSTVNSDTSIDFTVIPESDDVVAIRGSLIDISVDDIKVSGEVDTISSGESSAGIGYNSTSSSSY